ncbi:MAG: hypothetical protein ACI8XM_001449, partial [Haloarculaceae archaeon]
RQTDGRHTGGPLEEPTTRKSYFVHVKSLLTLLDRVSSGIERRPVLQAVQKWVRRECWMGRLPVIPPQLRPRSPLTAGVPAVRSICFEKISLDLNK